MRYAFFFATLLFSQFIIAQNKQITLEDIWRKGTFRLKSVPGFNGMKDGKRYTKIDREEGKQLIRTYDLQTGEQLSTLFDNGRKIGEKTISIDDYKFSEGEQKLLLFSEGKNIYRRSMLYNVYVFDINTNELQAVDAEKVLHASFSPDGNKVAFVLFGLFLLNLLVSFVLRRLLNYLLV